MSDPHPGMRFEGDNEELFALGVPQGSSEEVAVLGAQCCRTAAATGASDPAATGASAAATGALDPAAAGARAAATGASDPAAAGASAAATGASDPAATGAIAAATGAIDPAAAGASAAATGASDPAATGAIAAATGAIDPAATGASAAVDDLGALPQSGGWLYADEDQGAGWRWDNGRNTSAGSRAWRDRERERYGGISGRTVSWAGGVWSWDEDAGWVLHSRSPEGWR